MPNDRYISATEELVMLCLLKQHCYGVQIVELIEKATEGERFINPGTLYPLLSNLQRRGLIQVANVDEQPSTERAGRPRKYYQLTQAGEDALKETIQVRKRLLTSSGVRWLDF